MDLLFNLRIERSHGMRVAQRQILSCLSRCQKIVIIDSHQLTINDMIRDVRIVSRDSPMLALRCSLLHLKMKHLFIIPKTKYLSIYNIYLNLYIFNIRQSSAISYEATQYSPAILEEPPGVQCESEGSQRKSLDRHIE